MDQDQFWAIIDKAVAAHPSDLDACNSAIEYHLHTLAPGEWRSFGLCYDALDRTAFTWPLWGAAYQINGGCSDDGFDYFRAWLISRGRAVFEAALADPDTLAGHVGPGDEDFHENEDFLSLAREHLKDEDIAPFPTDPAGEQWDFDDEAEMQRRFPRLIAAAPEPGPPADATTREVLPGFASLGYRIHPDANAFVRLMEAVTAVADRYPGSVGTTYLDSGDHHRLWVNPHLERDQTVLEGNGMPGMVAFVRHPVPGPLVRAWVVQPAQPDSGDPFPVCFSSPHQMLGSPPPDNELSQLTLTMLADECRLFDTAAALAADPQIGDLAPAAFAAIGLYDDAGKELAAPTTRAFLTGTILLGVKATNALTDYHFWSLRVRTLHGELWVCLPIDALDHDPTGQIMAVTGGMSGHFPETIPDPLPDSEPEESRHTIDGDLIEARIRELTIAFMQTDEFTPVFDEIHPDKVTVAMAKGIGLFNKSIRQVSKTLADTRQLGTPALRQRYLQLAQSAPIVFAHVVMANTMLLEEGTGSPALVVLTWDDDTTDTMSKARGVLSRIHFSTPEDPQEQALAALIEDEDYHFGRRRPLPAWLVGDTEAYAADLWVTGAAVDNERLQHEVIICFAEPGPEGLTFAIPGQLIQQAFREQDPNASPPPLPPGLSPPPLPPSAPPPLPPLPPRQ